jgi:hypothetical protein
VLSCPAQAGHPVTTGGFSCSHAVRHSALSVYWIARLRGR